MKRFHTVLASMLMATAAFAQTEYQFGDVNKDTRINISDATNIVNKVLGSGFDLEYDINGDGLCDIRDVTFIVKCILTATSPTRPVAVVDLGLSVKWAAYNLGATTESGSGNFYAWGETAPKEEYTGANSLTYDQSMNYLLAQGIIGSNGELSPEYDAATVALGENWRMPSSDEMWELYSRCTWEDTDEYFPVLGVKVTGPNGQSIFLPEAGEKNGTAIINEGYYGYFWTLASDDLGDAFGEFKGISLGFTGKDRKWVSSNHRYIGLPIRPVMVK